jgi:hypothetical protein
MPTCVLLKSLAAGVSMNCEVFPSLTEVWKRCVSMPNNDVGYFRKCVAPRFLLTLY